MMPRIEFVLFFAITISILEVLSDEHQTEKLIQTKVNRISAQQTTSLYSNLAQHSQYPNHQILNYHQPQHTGGLNLTKAYNNHQTVLPKRTSNHQEFPKNHRIDDVSMKREKIQPQVETKKIKFNLNINEDDEDYRPNNHMANKHKNMRNVLINLLKRNENNKNFAGVLPILKVMSPAQRLAMASLVTNQISSEGKNDALKLAQVKSMFGNNSNATSDLMLPIILDIAKLFRALKDYSKRKPEKLPRPELLKRSFSENEDVDFSQAIKTNPIRSQRRMDMIDSDEDQSNVGVINNSTNDSINDEILLLNGTLVEPMNSTSEGLPVAEELRYVNKFMNGPRPMPRPSLVRRPIIALGQKPLPNRRISIEQQRRRQALNDQQRKATEPVTCNLFTDNLCLDVSDYPINAIMSSIRKNFNAMTALHSDFPEISAESTLDGITKTQEGKYTPEHYLNNINRREDGANQQGDASGFMCPSIVKYARPQKARATSGQWKYIVNTEEHTQTLRLEKCLKPKESCTFLTDNFKSKCIQVYNYHRLLTWDQQNGLHMDIFKVPTCCSCHIEGYSFAFPPHGGKPFEATSEFFPGEELVHNVDKNLFAYASTPKQQSISKEVILDAFRNGNSEEYAPSHFNYNNKPHIKDVHHAMTHPFSAINSNYYDDIQSQDSNIHIRNVKKPPRDDDQDSNLPSYLEPPSKQSIQKNKAGNVYVKRGQVGNQSNNVLKRPIRKPIRKKISNDDQELGASDINYRSQSTLHTETANANTKVPVIIRSPKDEGTSKPNLRHSSTTERQSIKIGSDNGSGHMKDSNSLNRRVNYNYHPIIDFFEEATKEKRDQFASDRMDSSTEHNFHEESDWRPMNGPITLKQTPLALPNNHG